jgi:hypothetical protein
MQATRWDKDGKEQQDGGHLVSLGANLKLLESSSAGSTWYIARTCSTPSSQLCVVQPKFVICFFLIGKHSHGTLTSLDKMQKLTGRRDKGVTKTPIHSERRLWRVPSRVRRRMSRSHGRMIRLVSVKDCSEKCENPLCMDVGFRRTKFSLGLFVPHVNALLCCAGRTCRKTPSSQKSLQLPRSSFKTTTSTCGHSKLDS